MVNENHMKRIRGQKRVESECDWIGTRKVAFKPTPKGEIRLIRGSALRRKKMSSPEVLDAAADSEGVASGQHPEIRDEEEAEEV
jgi:hypothetical protein